MVFQQKLVGLHPHVEAYPEIFWAAENTHENTQTTWRDMKWKVGECFGPVIFARNGFK